MSEHEGREVEPPVLQPLSPLLIHHIKHNQSAIILQYDSGD